MNYDETVLQVSVPTKGKYCANPCRFIILADSGFVCSLFNVPLEEEENRIYRSQFCIDSEVKKNDDSGIFGVGK